MKRLPNENKYQLDIKDQFKNEFEVGQLQGNNFHMTDSADLPMYIEPQGNIEQEVIEAVEGIVVEGSNINVNDVDNNYEDSIMPQGNIEQDSRVGYNCIDASSGTLLDTSSYGVTSSRDKDVITLNGTANGSTTGFLTDLDYSDLVNGETYRFSIEIISGEWTAGAIGFRLYDSSNKQLYALQQAYNTTNGKQEMTFTGDIAKVQLYFTGACVFSNLKFKVLLTKGTEVKVYEQYGSMPSLAFPSEVKGVSGHYDTLVQNENLIIDVLQNTNINPNGMLSYLEGFTVYIARVKKGKKYRANTHSTMVFQVRAFYTTKPNSSTISYDNTRIVEDALSFTSPIDGYVAFRTSNTHTNVMLYEGEDIRTHYTPHQEQQFPIDIPFNMYSGKPYKVNGKWYRPIEYGKYVFTGQEVFSKHSSTSNNAFYINPSNNPIKDAKLPANNNINCECYSNNFSSNSVNNLVFKGLMGIGISSVNDIYCATSLNGISTIADFKAHLAEQYAKRTPLYVVYPLAEPYAEEITDTTLIEQLEAFNTAELYDGVTNINSYKSSEDVAEMPLEVHYNFITPSPSVKRPSEVKDVSGHYDIVVSNKNLAKMRLANANFITGQIIEGGNANYVSNKIPVDNNSMYFWLNGEARTMNRFAYDKQGNFIGNIGTSIDYKPSNITAFDVSKIAYLILVAGVTTDLSNLLVNYSSTDTEYIEHQEQNLPIDIPTGKVLYNEKAVVELTDAEIEELGLEKAELYFKDEWVKKVLTGAENYDLETSDIYTRFNLGISDIVNIQARNTNVKSNYFKSTVDNGYSVVMAYENRALFYPTSDITTVEEFKAMLKEKYDSGNPVYIVYKLAKPIYTPIKDENFIKQYRALQKAFSYYPVTNVNSYKPTVNVADLKLYVEYFKSNKITNK